MSSKERSSDNQSYYLFELAPENKHNGLRRKSLFPKRIGMFEVSKSKASVCLKMLEKARQERVVSEIQYCSLSCQVPF